MAKFYLGLQSATLTVGAAGSSRTLSWGAVSGNEGYRVEWGSTSGTYPNSATVATNVTSYVVTPGAGTWYWRVAALVNGYAQRWSDEASFTV